MTKAEAEKFVRGTLYNYRQNAARLAQKLDKYEIAKRGGSRAVQMFGDGSKMVSYIDSTPWWIEAIELLEREIIDLRFRVLPIERLLKDLEETLPDIFIVYKLKYEQHLSWEKACEKASVEHGIGVWAFKTLNRELIKNAILYLDLRIENGNLPETNPGINPETNLENVKT